MTANGNGNGNGRPAEPQAADPGHVATLATLDAPGRLAYVLANVTGADVAAARRFLREAGYPVTITAGRNDEAPDDGAGQYAAHPVNIEDAGWSYSARGSIGHEDCCALRPRGIYQGMRLAGQLPYCHARLMVPDGRASVAVFLMSRARDGARQVITWNDLDRGTWMHRLGMGGQSRARHIRDAVATVVFALAYDDALPERPLSLTPSARTEDGRVPVPDWATLPPGYGDQPPDGPARDAARAAWIAIAARCPQVALIMGASLAGPLAAAMGVQSCLWELAAGARLGKTTTVQLAAAMWGRPSLPPEPGILSSWDASAKGMGRAAGMLGTLPLFADESGTADFAPAEWARFTYGQTQGASRLVSSVDGQARRTPGWAGFMILSGNGSITEGVRAGKFAGVPARVLTLGGPFTASAADCDDLAAAVAADYGHVGPAVLRAVTVPRFRELHAEARAEIGAPDGGTLGTNAAQLAAAVAALAVADTVLGTGTALHDAGLAAARNYLGTVAEPETDREIALRALDETMAADRASWPDLAAYEATGRPDESVPGQPASRADIPLHGVGREVSGVRHDGWVHVFPRAWDAIVAESLITGPRALADMHARGELHVADSWRARGEWRTPGPRHAGRRLPAGYRISLDAIAAAAGADDTTPPPAPEPAPATEPPTAEPAPVPEPAPAAEPVAEPLAAGWGPGTNGEAANPAADRYSSPAPAPAPAAVRNPAPAVRKSADVHPADVREHQDHAAPADPRAAWLTASRVRTRFNAEQQAELARIVALLDENPDPADKTKTGKKDKTPLVDLTDRLQFLGVMDGSREGSEGWGGPFLPTLNGRGASLSPWRKHPEGLNAAEIATNIEGYWWERDDYDGEEIPVDRNGAWIGALQNAKIALRWLDPTGPMSLRDAKDRAGYVKVRVYPWHEADMPSPLGTAKPGTEIVVSTEIAGLLYELAGEGRWPDDDVIDSWTSTEVTHLTAWGILAREQRRYGLEFYGRESGAYPATKDAVSKALSLMAGDREMGQGRRWQCKAHRPDWRHAVIANSAVFTWRALDRCRKMAGGNRDLMPVALSHKDALRIPAAAFELFTTQNYPGGKWPPVRIDPTTINLGTWKVSKAGDDR